MQLRADERRRNSGPAASDPFRGGRRCEEQPRARGRTMPPSRIGSEAGMMEATTPGRRILVVDDNATTASRGRSLGLKGYADIQIAEDGEQAIARLDKENSTSFCST